MIRKKWLYKSVSAEWFICYVTLDVIPYDLTSSVECTLTDHIAPTKSAQLVT